MDLKSIIFLAFVFLLFGCPGQQWDIYTNEKFSISYPVGNIEETQGDEIFKVSELGCQITVTKLTGQPSFSGVVDYLKGFYTDTEGLTLTSEKITDSSADFGLIASTEDERYEGAIRIIPCGDKTVYITMVGCGEAWYNQEKVSRIINSVQCK